MQSLESLRKERIRVSEELAAKTEVLAALDADNGSILTSLFVLLCVVKMQQYLSVVIFPLILAAIFELLPGNL